MMPQNSIQRTILWVVFSMSLLFLWDGWQKHNGKPSMFGGPPPATQAQGKTDPSAPAKPDPSVPAATTAIPGATTGSSTPAASTAAVPGQPAAAAGAPSTAVRVRSDVLQLDIDPQGAQVTRAELLMHRDIEKKDQHVTLLSKTAGSTYLAQTGLIDAPAGTSYPTHATPFVLQDGPRELAPGQDKLEVKLVAESGGLKVLRTYVLTRGAYVIDVKNEITNVGTTPAKPTLYMQLTRDANKPPGESQFYSTYTGPVIYTDKSKFQKVDFSDIEKKKATYEKAADDGWVGIIQHYFVTAWVPAEKVARQFEARKVDENLYAVAVRQPLAEIAPGATVKTDSRLLIGPQDQQMLEKVAPGLDLTVDYGWLTFIAKPIYWLLELCHRVVGNWGWAIVLLTIIIKTGFFPLQAASYRSMARMKAVTPRMMQIRERYGNDRAKMNQAMMELYKTEKINPLGGCLPIVVQIPVFIALYWVLLASVEMRNAPWIGYIRDLAAPDPYYILPLIMAVTMFVQTKLNPTPPDPVQAKMMMFMPLIFSVMFFFFPSGLVLYWLVNNCYSIAQQWIITRRIEGKPIFGRAAAS